MKPLGKNAIGKLTTLFSLPWLFAGCAAAPAQTTPAQPAKEVHASWLPDLDDRLQVQYADYPPDLSIDAQIYAVDLFETPQASIDQLHAAGKKVICYLNTGSWEEYRPDAADFQAEIIGKDYEGWAGEKWLDISRYERFAVILEKRFDLARQKGCDGIDADNMQNYSEDTGFAISAQDQLTYNRWLSEQAHKRGMAIGLKNDPEQAVKLLAWFDWALIEDCSLYGWCGDLLPFVDAGKTVFQLEYTDTYTSTTQFCRGAQAHRFSGLLKNRELDGWVQFCPQSLE